MREKQILGLGTPLGHLSVNDRDDIRATSLHVVDYVCE